MLRALTARIIHLHTVVTVLERDAIDGLLTVEVNGAAQMLGPALAGSVFVQPVSTPEVLESQRK